jgi:hypothetical protein|tara:strand:- start:2826 stop:3146 length:321 start_codon:yes stop_codon:yes gene_type:complete
MSKGDFRKPLGRDLNGLYITEAQMQFFLNRRNGGELFILGDPKFFKYFHKCAVYNIVWDLMEKDPACATFFWDTEEENVGVKFPLNGSVMKELKKRKVKYVFDEDD